MPLQVGSYRVMGGVTAEGDPDQSAPVVSNLSVNPAVPASSETKALVASFLAGDAGTPHAFVRKLLLSLLPKLEPAWLQLEGSGAGVPQELTVKFADGVLPKRDYVQLIVNSLAPLPATAPPAPPPSGLYAHAANVNAQARSLINALAPVEAGAGSRMVVCDNGTGACMSRVLRKFANVSRDPWVWVDGSPEAHFGSGFND